MTIRDSKLPTPQNVVATGHAANDNDPLLVTITDSAETPADYVPVPETVPNEPAEAPDMSLGANVRRPWEWEQKGITPEGIEQAIEAEHEMAEEGRLRFERWCLKQVETGNMDATPGGKALARKVLGPIYESIFRYQSGEKGLLDPNVEAAIGLRKTRKGRQPGGNYRLLIADLDPMLIAGVTFQHLLAAGLTKATLTVACQGVFSSLERAAMFRSLQLASTKLAANVARQAAQRVEPQWKADNRVKDTLVGQGAAWVAWPHQDGMKLATTLLRLAMQTGMATTETRGTDKGKRSVTEVVLNPEWTETLKDLNESAALSKFHLRPFRVPPRDWVSPRDGCFWSDHMKAINIVGEDYSKARMDALYEQDRAGQMGTVYGALNALQATSWQINRRVLDVMQYLWDQGTCVGENMVQQEPLDLPIKPGKDAGEEVWKSYAQAAAIIHGENRTSVSQRYAFQAALGLATEYRDAPAIHFGWYCDFRGRMYPMQQRLNPQGSENAKALLTFSKTVPITDQQGADWLAIHGANEWGGDSPEGKTDKLPFAGRVAWVKANTGKIIACAEDPLATSWWRQASKPWLFLAFCFEWADFTEQGFGFESRLPVAIDGTCNGLQHLSAMSRDAKGARAVNLAPSDRPNDIYADVAEEALDSLRRSVQESNEFARGAGDMLEFGLDRKVTKRVVMTIPYGLSQHGANDYIRLGLEERAKSTGKQAPWRTPDGDLDRDRIRETRGHCEIVVWDAVRGHIGAAMGVMAWLQECSKRVVQGAGEDFSWVSASGFPVLQRYRKTVEMRIDVGKRTGERQNMRLQFETKEISMKDHKNGAAPNVVHSFDAAHAVFTINRCVMDGVPSFAFVHDSFGCHAQHMATLHEHTRQSFADIYRRDVLVGLQRQWELRGVEIDEPPMAGTFDVEQVRQSAMFFS